MMLFQTEMPTNSKEKMLYAALHLFTSKGYKNTSVLEIVELAHVSKTTFYQQFGSKEVIILQLYERLVDEITEEIRRAAENEPKVGYKAYAGIRRYLEICFEEVQIADLVLLESVGISREVENVRQEALHELANLIFHVVYEETFGNVDQQEIKMISQAMVGAINEVVIQNFRNKDTDKMDVEHMARLLNRLVTGAFKASFRQKS